MSPALGSPAAMSIDPTGTPPPDDARFRGPGALAGLSLASNRLHADDIAAVVAAEAAKAGMTELVIYLVDLEQRVLIPLPAPGRPVLEPLAVDGSLAGRAYRTEKPVVAGGEGGEARSGAGDSMLWFPLLDSAERLGVVSACVAGEVDDEMLTRGLAIVNLTAEIIANKSAIGDSLVQSRRTQDVSIAAEMRWAMLPPLTFTGRNLTISGILEPAYTVAGDAFDYAVNGDTAHVAILDAVGHGLEAARIANLAVVAYRHGRRRGLDQVETYRAMDEVLADQFGAEKFVTAQLASLTLSTGRLLWLNAGHPPPMVIRRRHRVDLVAEPCLPLGLGSQAAGTEEVAEIFLEPDDIVLFFTDGVVEARAEDGEHFGRERLADLVERAASAAQSPAETIRLVGHAVLAHQSGVLQDDATLLLLAWHGPPGADPTSTPKVLAEAGTGREQGLTG